MYRWFSEVMKRDQAFLGYLTMGRDISNQEEMFECVKTSAHLPKISSYSELNSISYFYIMERSASPFKAHHGPFLTHFDISIQIICSEHFSNLDKLVPVVVAVEERFFSEDLRE